MTEYAKRNVMALDKSGGYYCRHIMAMTTEGLHSKSDIAAELAWRDREIENLRSAIEETLEENRHLADGDDCTMIHLKRVLGNQK